MRECSPGGSRQGLLSPATSLGCDHVTALPTRFDRASQVLLLVAVVAACLPIWVPRYLPLFDLPNHLAAVFVWRHLHDPAYGLAEFYRLRLIPAPYWGYYLPLYLMSFVVPLEVASKLFFTAQRAHARLRRSDAVGAAPLLRALPVLRAWR